MEKTKQKQTTTKQQINKRTCLVQMNEHINQEKPGVCDNSATWDTQSIHSIKMLTFATYIRVTTAQNNLRPVRRDYTYDSLFQCCSHNCSWLLK